MPISSRCMSVFLRFKMGCHSLPIVRGRRSGVPRRLRLCSYCASHSVGDAALRVRLCCFDTNSHLLGLHILCLIVSRRCRLWVVASRICPHQTMSLTLSCVAGSHTAGAY